MDDEQPRRAPGPWRATGYAAEQVVWLVPLLLAFVLVVVGSVLVLIVVGIPLLLVGLPLLRAAARRHRRIAGRLLGRELPSTYRRPEGSGPMQWLSAAARDPLSWRDLVWALWAVTLGWAVSLIVVVLLLAVATGVLWWFGAVPLMRMRSQVDRTLLAPGTAEQLEERVDVLTRTRADAVDASAAELRRLERDLHDGTQARLVAVSMSLGMAEQQLDSDPDRARRTIADARTATTAALGELRSVVRGIHPPVLADRGLEGAVRALALDMAEPVQVTGSLPGRPPAPVESAVYFAVAECLANAAKHAGHQHAWVELDYQDGVLRVVVGDDGHGGADADAGTGMRGVMRRLAAFDGTMEVASPADGPTIVTLELPCDLSSPKTTPSSGPD
jgi:signal transduction histidine kinase